MPASSSTGRSVSVATDGRKENGESLVRSFMASRAGLVVDCEGKPVPGHLSVRPLSYSRQGHVRIGCTAPVRSAAGVEAMIVACPPGPTRADRETFTRRTPPRMKKKRRGIASTGPSQSGGRWGVAEQGSTVNSSSPSHENRPGPPPPATAPHQFVLRNRKAGQNEAGSRSCFTYFAYVTSHEPGPLPVKAR